MILDLLAQQRIAGRIEGEYLQGGVGGLQAMGLVRVLVHEADYEEARRIIREWESQQPALQYIQVVARFGRAQRIALIFRQIALCFCFISRGADVVANGRRNGATRWRMPGACTKNEHDHRKSRPHCKPEVEITGSHAQAAHAGIR